MEKYGVDQKQIDELIKLGVCKDPTEARTLVASEDVSEKIKEARVNAARARVAEIADAYEAAGVACIAASSDVPGTDPTDL